MPTLVRGLADVIVGGIDWVGSRSITSAYSPSATEAPKTEKLTSDKVSSSPSDKVGDVKKETHQLEPSALLKIKEQLAMMPMGDNVLGQTPWDELKAKDLLLVWEEWQAMRQWIHGFKTAIQQISSDP